MTLADFITTTGLTMTTTCVASNPHMPDNTMSHYRCTIRNTAGVRRQIIFSMGSAHTEPPTLEDVLDCLASDASSADEDFETWCDEYGYDSDSRKALKTYKAVQVQTEKLKDLVGEQFDTLVYETERL